MKLYIMRHGETDWNKERRLQGQADIPLNEFGRSLARQSAEGMKEIDIDVVYTSPLVRARETAELVSAGRQVPIIEDKRLREMSFGIYEGLSCSEDNWEIPDKEFEKFFFAPDQYTPPEGGDSFPEVVERVNSFLTELKTKSERNVLIVCHGVVVSAFLSIIMNRGIAGFWKSKVQKNCGVNIAEVNGDQMIILEEAVTYYQEEVKQW